MVVRSRHHVAVLAALVLTAACATAPPPQTAPATPALLTVVTWNLGAGRGDLHRFIDDLESGELTGTVAADYVLLLQEFRPEVISRGTPPLPRRLSVFVAPVREGTGNAIVSTAPLEDARLIELPRERQPRGAAIAAVRIGGEPLFVASTHLENRLGWRRGLFGDGARARQTAALLQRLPAGHGIVGGDMNTMLGADEPALGAFRNRFPDTPGQRQPTFRDRLVLDHLFFDLPDPWYATSRVIERDYGSDHRPVIAEIHRK